MAALRPDDDFYEENSEDLSYSDLDNFPDFLLKRAPQLRGLQLDHNLITALPRCIGAFTNLITLDISNNNMSYISKEIGYLRQLRTLVARNNHLDNDCLPKEIVNLRSLQVVNLSGNLLTEFPPQLIELAELRCLYLGANNINSLPVDIGRLKR